MIYGGPRHAPELGLQGEEGGQILSLAGMF